MTRTTSGSSGDDRAEPPAFDLRTLADRAAAARPKPPRPAGDPFREGEGVVFPVDDPDVASED